MKSFTILALNALFGAALAIPLEKRDTYTTTLVEDVIETVDVFTTVWVQPGDPRLGQNYQQATVPSSGTAATTSAYIPPQTSAAPAIVPQQNQEAKAVVKAPAPTFSSSPAPAPAPAPSTTPAVVAQPKVEAAAPVHSSPAPVSSPSTPAASTSGSGLSGGSCGQKGGMCTAENVTTFSGGLGACGFDDATYTENYFALAHDMMGLASNDNPYCNRTAAIVYNGQTFHGTLQDKCMGCGGASLDLSLTLFNSIFPTAGGTGNFHNIEWFFTS